MQKAKRGDETATSAVFGFHLTEPERTAYHLALRTLNGAGVPYVVGGAFAVNHYTGVWRNTRDFDVFVLPDDVQRAMEVLGSAGFRTWVVADYWLAKAAWGPASIDLIFGSGNWLAPVDRQWMDRGVDTLIVGVPTRVAAVEELIWSKAYVAGRERYDGADVVHLLLRLGDRLDWEHLIARFGDHWELLFSYLSLSRFVYPQDSRIVPSDVMSRLAARLRQRLRQPGPGVPVCQGTLLDRYSFNVDVERGYLDPREDLAAARGFSREEVVQEREQAQRAAGAHHDGG